MFELETYAAWNLASVRLRHGIVVCQYVVIFSWLCHVITLTRQSDSVVTRFNLLETPWLIVTEIWRVLTRHG